MEPYPSEQFGFIDDQDRQFGNSFVLTRIPTQSDGPEPLLTLACTLFLSGRPAFIGGQPAGPLRNIAVSVWLAGHNCIGLAIG